MYRVKRTKGFEKSYLKLKHSGVFKDAAQKKLDDAVDALSQGVRLPPFYRDHCLTGDLAEYRECHLKGDILLMYRIIDDELVLVLANIGTHSYLGL